MKLSDRLKDISIHRNKKMLDDLGNEQYELARRDRSMPPQNPLDLVRDLKAAFDEGLVLDESFFSSEQLKSFSGASLINRSGGDSHSTIYMTIDGIVKPVMIGSFLHSGLQYIFFLTKKDGLIYRVKAHLSFKEGQASLSFGAMIALFGKTWEDADRKPAPPGRVFRPATHLMGNRTIKFSSHYERIDMIYTIEFNPDGTMRSCTILGEVR